MTNISLSQTDARKLFVAKQRLSGPRPAVTTENIKDVLQDIRCIQIDPLRAVERTQYLVLFSRLGSFPLEMFDDLVYKDKYLFEYWAHAMSFVLMQDYPLYKIHMDDYLRRFSERGGNWGNRMREWIHENPEFQQYVLEAIEENGPLLTSDIEDRSKSSWGSSGWTSARNSEMMVSFLREQGKVMVANRVNGRKYWDIASRVLPEWTPTKKIDEREKVYRAAQLSLKALGAAPEKHISNHFIRHGYPGLQNILDQLAGEGKILKVDIEGDPDQVSSKLGQWFIHRDDLPLVDQIKREDWQPRTVLLSPFDNLICDRDRTELLWDFYFRIEIYVPKAKREYGYYVLPILHGENLIGRIDPKMDRKKGVLNVNNIYAEPGAPTYKKTGTAIRKTIEELADFLGAKTIDYHGKIPKGWDRAF